ETVKGHVCGICISMKNKSLVTGHLLVAGFLCFAARYAGAQTKGDATWTTYRNGPGGKRYSAAAEIHRGTAGKLKVAWTYRTGARDAETRLASKAALESTPILVNGKLY